MTATIPTPQAASPELIDAIFAGLEKGATIGDVAGLSAEALEAGYGLAYNLYGAGNHTDAEKLLSALCIEDHTDARVWMGRGGSRQAAGNLAGAIDAYNMASIAGALGDPAPSVHAGLCYLKLGDKENAIALFDAALEFGKPDDSVHQNYRDRAKALLDLIRKGE
ncbi:MAG: SycD/LcrH family type III secretion system chaperone [Candidatus Accumulibacter sp.]|jgi:type III secretion system low calcium response chaperone LcrH/SycD|nr:SycD/LcrH family type III secretion system chaperone [Accumulibacter sp.]